MTDKRTWFFIAVTAMVMYFFNIMTPLTLSDDVLYRCVWVDEAAVPVIPQQPVRTFGDIIVSQATHYFITNGRIVVHAVAQAILSLAGENVADVLNTLFFCMLIWMCARFTADANQYRISRKTSLFAHVVAFTFLFIVVIPGFRDVFLWTLGCINYMWTALAVMLFFTFFYHSQHRMLTPAYLLACPLALLAGWTHEALTLPLAFALCVWMVIERRRIGRSAALPAVVCFVAGALLCAFSPATIGRADITGMTPVMRLILGCYNLVAFMRITWLLILVAAVAWWYRRDILMNEVRRLYVLYFALVPAITLVILCGQTQARVCFHVDFISSLLLVSLLTKLGIGHARRPLIIAACGIMTSVTIVMAGFALRNHRNYTFQTAQQQSPDTVIIKVRQVPRTGSALFDSLVERYINPSVVFGFYSCYQGFDADDINLRSAAVLYGKQRMIYLPEDVVLRMQNDTAAYSRLGYDERNDIGILRIGNGRKVSRLRFILNPEKPESQPVYKRFLVYRNDIYDLPEAKFKTVTIDSRTYLIFARPLTNIRRRTKMIQISIEKQQQLMPQEP